MHARFTYIKLRNYSSSSLLNTFFCIICLPSERPVASVYVYFVLKNKARHTFFDGAIIE